MIKLDEESVSKIIKIAMSNNQNVIFVNLEECAFFAYSCLSNDYKYYSKG